MCCLARSCSKPRAHQCAQTAFERNEFSLRSINARQTRVAAISTQCVERRHTNLITSIYTLAVRTFACMGGGGASRPLCPVAFERTITITISTIIISISSIGFVVTCAYRIKSVPVRAAAYGSMDSRTGALRSMICCGMCACIDAYHLFLRGCAKSDEYMRPTGIRNGQSR